MIPENQPFNRQRAWTAAILSAFAAGIFTVLGIYAIEQYGIALFILTPLFLGAAPVLAYGLKSGIARRQSWQIGFLTLGIYTFGLILFAIEGLICIIMVAPLGILLTWAGSMLAYAAIRKRADKAPTLLAILLVSIPATAFMEKNRQPELTSVTTSIEIAADPHTVWKNVIEFPELDKPAEFIFKTGIAYPVNAKIEGRGVGAIRHCNFTTGSFVEPITIWDEPKLLKFDVREQPAPLKEISFWDIDAPHLHDYFVSRQGQFKLTRLPNGNTLLEGTTWYDHNIRPAFYWQIWSKHIVHKIHERVLKHIRNNSEHPNGQQL